MNDSQKSVGVFVTCMVNVIRPSVGWAIVRLIEAAGMKPVVPDSQSCCGQPALHGGCTKDHRKMAENFRAAFEAVDHIVVPSASCLSTIREYAHLGSEFEAIVSKTIQLETFVSQYVSPSKFTKTPEQLVVLHDSCSSVRRTNTASTVAKTLGAIPDCRVERPEFADECCGFGGAFAVEHENLSTDFADSKLKTLSAKGSCIVACDLGCLTHLEGRALRTKQDLRFMHTAEVLAEALGDAN